MAIDLYDSKGRPVHIETFIDEVEKKGIDRSGDKLQGKLLLQNYSTNYFEQTTDGNIIVSKDYVDSFRTKYMQKYYGIYIYDFIDSNDKFNINIDLDPIEYTFCIISKGAVEHAGSLCEFNYNNTQSDELINLSYNSNSIGINATSATGEIKNMCTVYHANSSVSGSQSNNFSTNYRINTVNIKNGSGKNLTGSLYFYTGLGGAGGTGKGGAYSGNSGGSGINFGKIVSMPFYPVNRNDKGFLSNSSIYTGGGGGRYASGYVVSNGIIGNIGATGGAGGGGSCGNLYSTAGYGSTGIQIIENLDVCGGKGADQTGTDTGAGGGGGAGGYGGGGGLGGKTTGSSNNGASGGAICIVFPKGYYD